MYRLTLVIAVLLTISCTDKKTADSTLTVVEPISFSSEQAKKLLSLPLSCIQKEYPNKTGHVMGDAQAIKSPAEMHPAFYGCFDWHSAVHGHWSIVTLLSKYPDLPEAEKAKQMLAQNLSKENIIKEVKYWDDKHNKSFERTYGWAWLLKLAEALDQWQDPMAQTLSNNLQPMTDLIVEKYIDFLPNLVYPIRVGEHTNTAFGLAFAYDYAVSSGNENLQNTIKQRAKDFYKTDSQCPLHWEPSGYDFLSPCLEEAHLMSKIMHKDDFLQWTQSFMPQLLDPTFSLAPGKVSDRSDGKLVHLDGLNFSRAWCLYSIANKLDNPGRLHTIAKQHIEYSLPNLIGDSYEGGHWLGSFAIYALKAGQDAQ